MQAAICRLDTVLLSFGYLVACFKEIARDNPEDAAICAAIIASIERRWSTTDQELFICAVLLHPLYRRLPFSVEGGRFNGARVSVLMARVYRRIFRVTEVPAEFYTHVDNYLEEDGYFDSIQEVLESYQRSLGNKVRTNPSRFSLIHD